MKNATFKTGLFFPFCNLLNYAFYKIVKTHLKQKSAAPKRAVEKTVFEKSNSHGQGNERDLTEQIRSTDR